TSPPPHASGPGRDMLNQAEAGNASSRGSRSGPAALMKRAVQALSTAERTPIIGRTRPRQFAPSTIRTSLLHGRCRFRKCANCSFSRIPLRGCSRPHGLLFGVERKFRASLEDLDENLHSTLITK